MVGKSCGETQQFLCKTCGRLPRWFVFREIREVVSLVHRKWHLTGLILPVWKVHLSLLRDFWFLEWANCAIICKMFCLNCHIAWKLATCHTILENPDALWVWYQSDRFSKKNHPVQRQLPALFQSNHKISQISYYHRLIFLLHLFHFFLVILWELFTYQLAMALIKLSESWPQQTDL